MTYAIVGAGIGGLTLALAFEQAGFDYRVFERTPVIEEVGAGIWLAPNALQVLDYLNIVEKVQKEGNRIDRIVIGRADLTPLSDTPQDRVKTRFGYTTVAIHRAKLQRVLLDCIPPEKIRLGKAFASFAPVADQSLQVCFADHTHVRTKYLIGADGIHSKIRQQLFPDSQIRYAGQTCWRGVADFTLPKDLQHTGMELWGNRVRFGFSKIAAGKVYWFAVALDRAHQKDEPNRVQSDLRDRFRAFHPLVRDLIVHTTPTRIYRNAILDLKPLNQWYLDRICLVGDTGHATTPNMGQGGAQAIEDAYFLTKALQQHPPQRAFAHFFQQRRKKVNRIVQQSWTTGQVAHWKYGQGLRNFFLKNLPRHVLEQKMMELYELEATVIE